MARDRHQKRTRRSRYLHKYQVLKHQEQLALALGFVFLVAILMAREHRTTNHSVALATSSEQAAGFIKTIPNAGKYPPVPEGMAWIPGGEFFMGALVPPGAPVKWMAHRAFLIVPAQAVVAKWLATFKEFPIRQKPASFSLDEVMRKMEPKD